MAGKIEWYEEFHKPEYKPAKDDLVCLFYYEADKGISVKEAVGRIASESSTGTWTTLAKLPARMKKLMAKAFEVRGNYVKVAYPIDLWDKGNIPQLLSGIAGNIFGMKAVKNLRLIDVSLPRDYIKHFKGPWAGIDEVKKRLKIKEKRPIFGAVPKPKIGFSAAEHAKIGYETWMGGFDIVKDDENLTSTNFNRFEDRVKLLTKTREKAEKETGDLKSAFINITGPVKVMEQRAKMLYDYGWEYAMIDVVVTGFAAVQHMRDVCNDYKLFIHAHRAMHAAMDRNPKHGVSMWFLAKMFRLAGVNNLHCGTGVGKLESPFEEVLRIADTLREKHVKQRELLLEQDWAHIKDVFPTVSGGVHPGIMPPILDKVGGDRVIFLVSGGIHGHPKGTRAGAKAAIQAFEAWKMGVSLEEYAKTHKELAQALEKWGHYKPK
ncbi:MAG: type III ribulose-bisphosphate carboxylase [Candidatus Anstonellales archaeon]